MKGGNLHGLGIRYVRYSWCHKTVKQSVFYGSTRHGETHGSSHFIDCPSASLCVSFCGQTPPVRWRTLTSPNVSKLSSPVRAQSWIPFYRVTFWNKSNTTKLRSGGSGVDSSAQQTEGEAQDCSFFTEGVPAAIIMKVI